MLIPSSTWFQTTVAMSSNTWFHTVVVIPRSTWFLKFVMKYKRLNSIFRELDSLAEVEKSRPRRELPFFWADMAIHKAQIYASRANISLSRGCSVTGG